MHTLKRLFQSLNYLYMGIESALAADMYVIVDWHILKDSDPNEYAEEAKEFFAEISDHYSGNPAILYEICNEPNGDTDWDDIVEYAEQIISCNQSQCSGSSDTGGNAQLLYRFYRTVKATFEI